MIFSNVPKLSSKVSTEVLHRLSHSIAFVFFAYLQRLSDPSSSIQILEAWIYIFLSIIFILLFIRISPQLKFYSFDLWYFIFLAVILVSTSWSEHPLLTLEKSFYLIVTTLFAIYLFVTFNFSDFLKVVTTGLLLVLTLSLVLLAIAPNKVVHIGDLHFGAWKGLYYHKSAFGREMGILSLLMLFTLKGSLRFVLFAICALAVYKSQSMISVLGVVLSLAYFFWEKIISRIQELRKYQNTLILMGAAVVIAIFLANFALVVELIGKDITLNGRLQIWLYSFFSMKQNLVMGYGFESFWQDQTLTHSLGWTVTHAHNMIIDLMLDGGILLLIPFSLMIIAFAKRWKRLSKNGSFASITLTTFSMLILISLMEETVYTPFDFKWIFFSCLIFYVSNPQKAESFNNYSFKIWRWS